MDTLPAAFVGTTPVNKVNLTLDMRPLTRGMVLREPQASYRYSLAANSDGCAITPPSEWALDWKEDEATTSRFGSKRAERALAYAASIMKRPLPPVPRVRPARSMLACLEPAREPELDRVLEAKFPPTAGNLRLVPSSPEPFEDALAHANTSHPSGWWSLLGTCALFTAVFFMRFLLSGFPAAEVRKTHLAQLAPQQASSGHSWDAREARVADERRAAKPERMSHSQLSSEFAPSTDLMSPKRARSSVGERSNRREQSKPARAAAMNMAASKSRPTHATAAAPAPARASNAAHTGTLRTNSLPWSDVYVDGKRIGTTPQMRLTLSVGKHRVRLVNTEFEMSKTFFVEIAKGKVVTKVVNLSL